MRTADAARRQAAPSSACPDSSPLGLNFSLYLDGLSALFGLIITGIGTLVVLYTGYYFDHPADDKQPHLEARFFAYILLFMFAMLGVVLAGDLITMFIFWEGTSISSFLLIGYKYKDEAAQGRIQIAVHHGRRRHCLLAGVPVRHPSHRQRRPENHPARTGR